MNYYFTEDDWEALLENEKTAKQKLINDIVETIQENEKTLIKRQKAADNNPNDD